MLVIIRGTASITITNAEKEGNREQPPRKPSRMGQPRPFLGRSQVARRCRAIKDCGNQCQWWSNAGLRTRATPFVAGLCQFHKSWESRAHPAESLARVLGGA